MTKTQSFKKIKTLSGLKELRADKTTELYRFEQLKKLSPEQDETVMKLIGDVEKLDKKISQLETQQLISKWV